MQKTILSHSKLAILGTALSIMSINQAQCMEAPKEDYTEGKTLTEVLGKLTAKQIQDFIDSEEHAAIFENKPILKSALTKMHTYIAKKDTGNKKENDDRLLDMITEYDKIKIDAKTAKKQGIIELATMFGIKNPLGIRGLLTNDENLSDLLFDKDPVDSVPSGVTIANPDGVIDTGQNTYKVKTVKDKITKAKIMPVKMSSPSGLEHIAKTIYIASDKTIGPKAINDIKTLLGTQDLTENTLASLQTTIAKTAITNNEQIIRRLIEGTGIGKIEDAVGYLKTSKAVINPKEKSESQLKTALGDKWESVQGVKRSKEINQQANELYKHLFERKILDKADNTDATTFKNEKEALTSQTVTINEIKKMSDMLDTAEQNEKEANKKLQLAETALQNEKNNAKNIENRIQELNTELNDTKNELNNQKSELEKFTTPFKKYKDGICENFGISNPETVTLAKLLAYISDRDVVIIPTASEDEEQLSIDEAAEILKKHTNGLCGNNNPLGGSDSNLAKENKDLIAKNKKLEAQNTELQNKLLSNNTNKHISESDIKKTQTYKDMEKKLQETSDALQNALKSSKAGEKLAQIREKIEEYKAAYPKQNTVITILNDLNAAIISAINAPESNPNN